MARGWQTELSSAAEGRRGTGARPRRRHCSRGRGRPLRFLGPLLMEAPPPLPVGRSGHGVVNAVTTERACEVLRGGQ